MRARPKRTASRAANGRNIRKPSTLIVVAATRGATRAAATRPQMMKSASPTTAPKTRRLPRGAFGPAGGGAAGGETLRAGMPRRAGGTPPARAGVSRSGGRSTARVPATAGVVLVTIPARRPPPGRRGRAPRRACRRRPSSRRSPSRRRARGRRGGDPGAERLRPALDLVRELAEGADRPGGDLAAAHALAELDRLGALERGAGLVQKAEQEIVLRARRDLLHPAQDLLVSDRGRPLRERALLDDVVDPSQERVRRRLPLGEAIEGLHAPDELRVRGRQRGRLARERLGAPVRDRAEQGGRLVDQHVPERERVLAAGDGDEQVLVLLEHAVLPDRLTDLVAEKVEKIRSAEGGVVAAELEYRRPAALPALHCRGAREAAPLGGLLPPLMTGLSSMEIGRAHV